MALCLEHFFIFSFYSYSHLHPVLRNRHEITPWQFLGDGEANHFEFQIYHHKWRRFRSEEGNTNLNKFFHCDENVEIYREMRLWSVPCIGCSSSCFGVLYATTVDWQMIQRYLRHLSFYSAPSCLSHNGASIIQSDTVEYGIRQRTKLLVGRKEFTTAKSNDRWGSSCASPLKIAASFLIAFKVV